MKILLPALLLLCAGAARADDPAPATATPAPAACKYVQTGELAIRYVGAELQPTVEGSINNTPATMLLDTGAHATYLTRTGTDKRDLYLRSSGGRSASGIGGSSAVYLARVEQFAVGPAVASKMNMRVLDSMGFTPSFDAIIGADYLLHTDVEIALADKSLKFFRNESCKDRSLAYWDPGAVVLPMRSNGENRNPRLTVLVNGVELEAIIDTGAAYSAITDRAAKRAGVQAGMSGVDRAGTSVGVGGQKAGRWHALFNKVQIGDETITNADIDIIEELSSSRDRADILLGADFMRAHRVLLAVSQRRVYISYLGGPAFGAPRDAVAPWLLKEAEDGNPDAQYRMAQYYRAGRLVAKDSKLANAWLEKAAAQNHQRALIQVVRNLRGNGKPAEAVQRLRAALALRPDERILALELFLAQTQIGEGQAAKSELAALKGTVWPAPVADFYLGKIDDARLLKLARDDDGVGQARACEAGNYIGALYDVMGDPARARSVRESVLNDCKRIPG